jgi:conjugal transfer pilin signal peptidase TrbI
MTEAIRGYLTPFLIWSMAAAPLLLAICKVPRKVFLGITGAVGGAALVAWVASAGYGYRFAENLTTSLNGSFYVYKAGDVWQKGDYVAFRSNGSHGYPVGATFIKIVVGVPGDVVIRDDRAFFVGDAYVGTAKTHAKTGKALEPAEGGLIPPGEYFLATPNPDSFDSRYAAIGNVKANQIVGRARELF